MAVCGCTNTLATAAPVVCVEECPVLRTIHRHGLTVAFGAGLLWGGAAAAGQIDSASYFALRTGMTESEVLVRVGEPDRVSYPSDEISARRSATLLPSADGGAAVGVRSHAQVHAVKRWHYIPESSESDPHITVITLRGDRVAAIERIKVFSRAQPAPATDRQAVRSARKPDRALEHAQRVLDAAREYAAIRARLKSGAPATIAPAAKIHRAPGATYLTE